MLDKHMLNMLSSENKDIIIIIIIIIIVAKIFWDKANGKSLIKTKNNNDPYFEPCGTPDKISPILDFLAHLSQRLIGELIVYSCSGVRPSVLPSVVVVRRPQFQTSSPKPLAR